MMEVEKHLIKFALANILRGEAVKEGLYHDQDTLESDLQGIIDSGSLPSGWYKLNVVAGIYKTTWDDG